MSPLTTRPNSLEALVRTALLNKELAPGVAARIEPYRAQLAAGKLSKGDKRLLAVLNDAIADNLVTVISNPIQQPTIQEAASDAIAQPQLHTINHSS